MHLLYDQKIVLSQYLDIVASECVMVLHIASTITGKCATNVLYTRGYSITSTETNAKREVLPCRGFPPTTNTSKEPK